MCPACWEPDALERVSANQLLLLLLLFVCNGILKKSPACRSILAALFRDTGVKMRPHLNQRQVDLSNCSWLLADEWDTCLFAGYSLEKL